MDQGAGGMAGMDHGSSGGSEMAGMAGMSGMNMRDTSLLPPNVKVGPGIDSVAMNPIDRMDFPGLGLDDVSHRVLNYNQLIAAKPNTDNRRPSRLKTIHLTGNMERYMWSFDGKKFDEITEPIQFAYNERVRVKLINNTMMAHPIHLHGHFFELVNGAPADRQPLKHTLTVRLFRCPRNSCVNTTLPPGTSSNLKPLALPTLRSQQFQLCLMKSSAKLLTYTLQCTSG